MFCFSGPRARGSLTPWGGIKPATPCMRRWSLNHWTAREVSCKVTFELRKCKLAPAHKSEKGFKFVKWKPQGRNPQHKSEPSLCSSCASPEHRPGRPGPQTRLQTSFRKEWERHRVYWRNWSTNCGWDGSSESGLSSPELGTARRPVLRTRAHTRSVGEAGPSLELCTGLETPETSSDPQSPPTARGCQTLENAAGVTQELFYILLS